MSSRLRPSSKIGIIGGGQLGQMMGLSAIQSGHTVAVLDPDPNCPCAVFAQPLIVADYTDVVALAQLCELCDVVTYEFENADSALIDGFNINDKIPQGVLALTLSQHRLKEKAFAQFLEIPTPAYLPVRSQEDLSRLNDFPLIIKSCRYGYDGKHQFVVHNAKELTDLNLDFPSEYIAEKLIRFEKEISVVCARFKDGISFYEPFENVHVNGILSTALHPAILTPLQSQQALEYTEKIAQALDYIGVLAVEYFVTQDGILFNEMAPRPHNSAHGTIEGCTFSQFDLHVAAITNAPVIQPRRIAFSMMINVLGQDYETALSAFQQLDPDLAHLHLYGKKENRTNRKVGHVTLCAATLEDLVKEAQRYRRLP
jgi:5-(carboxyamino)imidazole ribonucleotide synthase